MVSHKYVFAYNSQENCFSPVCVCFKYGLVEYVDPKIYKKMVSLQCVFACVSSSWNSLKLFST